MPFTRHNLIDDNVNMMVMGDAIDTVAVLHHSNPQLLDQSRDRYCCHSLSITVPAIPNPARLNDNEEQNSIGLEFLKYYM